MPRQKKKGNKKRNLRPDRFYLPVRTLTGPSLDPEGSRDENPEGQGEDPERAESREPASAIRRIEQVLGCLGGQSTALASLTPTCRGSGGRKELF